MKKMLGSVVATALCAVSFCALSAPRAHAANPKVIYTGQVQDAPQVIVTGVDGAKNVDVNKLTQQMTDAFSGTDWNVLDNHTIVISKSGKAVMTLPYAVASKDLSIIIPHARTATAGVDGLFVRSTDDPTQGFTDLWITQPISGGGTFTFWIDASLAF